jgi:hypothetical protein
MKGTAASARYAAGMSTSMLVVLSIGTLGCALYVGNSIRSVLLQRRNLVHYEKNEPLEGGVDRWD